MDSLERAPIGNGPSVFGRGATLPPKHRTSLADFPRPDKERDLGLERMEETGRNRKRPPRRFHPSSFLLIPNP